MDQEDITKNAHVAAFMQATGTTGDIYRFKLSHDDRKKLHAKPHAAFMRGAPVEINASAAKATLSADEFRERNRAAKRLANLQARSREALVPLFGAMSVLGVVGDLTQADAAVQTAVAGAQAYLHSAARLVLGQIGALTAEREKLLVLPASTLSSEPARPQQATTQTPTRRARHGRHHPYTAAPPVHAPAGREKRFGTKNDKAGEPSLVMLLMEQQKLLAGLQRQQEQQQQQQQPHQPRRRDRGARQ